MLTTLKDALVFGVGGVALTFSDGSFGQLLDAEAGGTCSGVPETARLGAAGFGAAVVSAMWSYDGWITATDVAEEVSDPGRTIPRALVGSVVVLIALYLWISIGYFLCAHADGGRERLGAVFRREPSALRRARTDRRLVMAMGLMLSIVGSTHALALAAARAGMRIDRDLEWRRTRGFITMIAVGVGHGPRVGEGLRRR